MPVATARWLSRLSLAGLGMAPLIALRGHFNADELLSPVQSTISAYAAMDPLGLVEIAIYLSAFACLTLLGAMFAARIPVGGVLTTTLTIGGLGFLVAAVIPTVEVGTPMTTEGLIHRYASVSACAALLIASLLLVRLADRQNWHEIRIPLLITTWISSVSGVAVVYAMFFGDRVFIGLYERILCAALLGTLLVVSVHISRLPVTAERDVALAL
ncbi:uncharacterized protein DUF998 [Stackebrandtia endophytica]|uniref:Uncharacterized protein DUF998 n=1 Tax=Stackebrandtia endophytica TaxID=1496996 RepID=A0A543AYY1_9ACTN|nr:DUF998 domain-containing protein [Stackebrandtia endophytica]TQL77787.1 uncharacterized protein DUF998 [Stackebrandtia endophytica]